MNTGSQGLRLAGLRKSVLYALGVESVTVRPFRSGVDCFVDIVEIDARPPAVVRSARHEVVDTSYEGEVRFADIVAKDVEVLNLLSQAGVPTPSLIAWHQQTGSEDVSWMITSYVEHLSSDDVAPAAHESLGALARRIHDIKPVGSRIHVLQADRDWETEICGRILQRIDAARAYVELAPSSQLEPVIRASVAGRNEHANSLLHLDLRGPNLAVTGRDISCVFDYSNAMVGDLLLELARIDACGLLSDAFERGYGRSIDTESMTFLTYGLDIHALLAVVAVEEFTDPQLQQTSIAHCIRITDAMTAAKRG